MPITIEIWEDSGPLSVGVPSVRQKVDNLGWKNSGLDETYPYYDYVLNRPYDTSLYTLSYKKYYYFKFSGTWTGVITPKFELIGAPGSNNRIFYRWTSTYAEPDNTFLNGSYYDPSNPPEWNPLMTTSGDPRNANTYYPNPTSGSYTTGYLVTQVQLDPDTVNPCTNYGNLGSISLKANFHEVLTLLNFHEYDGSHVNWSNNGC